MMRFRTFFVVIAVFLLAASISAAGEPVDYAAVTKIRDQGFRHSQVMDIAWHLTEAIGPRLTGSPQELQAHQWAKAKFEEWGLVARLEDYDFGRSWAADRVQVRLVAPYVQPLEALPEAWTPGTEGPVQGKVVRANLESEEDLEKWAGKLAGAIVLSDDEQGTKQVSQDLFRRWDGERLAELEMYEIPGDRKGSPWRKRMLKRYQFWEKLAAFFRSGPTCSRSRDTTPLSPARISRSSPRCAPVPESCVTGTPGSSTCPTRPCPAR